MLLKRAADIAEALYSVPRPHSQLQALPSSPAHGSVMGLGSYPSQLGVSIGEPGQSSQGEQIQHKQTDRYDVNNELHFVCFVYVAKFMTELAFSFFLQVTFEIPAVCPRGVTHQPPLLSSQATGAAEG